MALMRFNTSDDLNQSLSQQLALILTDAILQRGHAYLVVSGGNSPKALFQRLSMIDLPWEKVTITLTDERWVSPDSPESNEQMVKDNLLQHYALKAHFISLYADEKTPYIAVNKLTMRVASLPTFDAVILGLGLDGHTASLFPCSEEINAGLADNNDNALLAISPTTAPYQRVTLTKTRLLNSRAIFLYLVGESKLLVLNQALLIRDPRRFPIYAFLNHPAVDVQVLFAPY